MYSSLKKPQLKEICRDLGVKVSGTIEDLETRLYEYLAGKSLDEVEEALAKHPLETLALFVWRRVPITALWVGAYCHPGHCTNTVDGIEKAGDYTKVRLALHGNVVKYKATDTMPVDLRCILRARKEGKYSE